MDPRQPDEDVAQTAEQWLSMVGFADSRAHSSTAIARLMEDYHVYALKRAAPAPDEGIAALVRIGYCPSHKLVEWIGCYTICTVCHRALVYGTVEDVERATGQTRPSWWAPEKVIGYRPQDRARQGEGGQP